LTAPDVIRSGDDATADSLHVHDRQA
jgi:hypothetical protein